MEGTNGGGEAQTIDNITGNEWHKCTQKDTIQRIFTLWQDLERERKEDREALEKRDKALKKSYDNTLKAIDELRNDLEKRKLINNFNEKEKKQLESWVKDIGDRSEFQDKSLTEKVDDLDGRLIVLETSLPKIIETVEDTAKKYDRLFWLLVAFFILFMIKTFIWGY